MPARQATHSLDPDFDSIGLVIVDHGSRRRESNDLLLAVADEYRRHARLRIVEPAHMELAEPSIATAFARCAEQGAKLVVVFPFFLGPGRHWSEDIPRLVAAAAAKFPNVQHIVTAPLGLHPLILRVIDQRITQCMDRALGAAGSCEFCDAGGGCHLQPAAPAKHR